MAKFVPNAISLNNIKLSLTKTLNQSTNILLQETIPDVPLDKGPLRASGLTEEAVESKGIITSKVSFNTYYAVYVHEILRYHHPIGKAKFLEDKLNESFTKILNSLQAVFK